MSITSRKSNKSTNKSKENSDDTKKLYKNDPTKFTPKLYNFKLSKDTMINESALASSPPFWVLVDHLIGVVWKLYSKQKDGRKLGIIQLQWALEFIKMIKDDNGNLTKTLEGVKNTIEDALILKYASLPEEKEDNLSEDSASSEGKQPSNSKSAVFEGLPQTSQNASFTLRDVMSRTPKNGDKLSSLPPVSAELPLDGTKSDVNRCKGPTTYKPASPPEKMKSDDILKYLLFLKKEQSLRVTKEKNELERIQDAINQVEAGQFDIESWVKKNENKDDETDVRSKKDKSTENVESIEKSESKEDKKSKKSAEKK